MKKTLQISILLLLLFIFATGTVFAETSSQTVNLIIGQSKAQINGKDIAMTAPAQIISGTTLVPLRFIGENLGAEVNYDAATKGISILMNYYQNKSLDFEVVIPTGWTVSEESAEDVVISNGKYAALLGLADNSPGITNTYFKGFTDGFFDSYATKVNFYYLSKSDRLAAGGYEENGVTYYIVLKWLDNGAIYYCALANNTDSYNEAMSVQANILANTLKPYTAK